MIFGENNNYHQNGKSYPQYDITIRKADITNFNDEKIRMVNNGFAYTFKEDRLATTGGSDIEHKNFVGQISTIMRLINNKDGDFFSCFDGINGNIINFTSLK